MYQREFTILSGILRMKYMMRKRTIYSLVFVAVLTAFVIRIQPSFLVWPYRAESSNITIYSELPINGNISSILQSAVRYRARSSIATPMGHQEVYITKGGWRWHLLALRSNGAFAISMPFVEHIVVNNTSIERNEVRTGRPVGGVRPLDRVLAHELTHGVLRQHFGIFRTLRELGWLVEGYCDYVAGNSSLTADDVAQLKARRERHPAIPYFEGRMRISRLIEQEQLTVEQLFSKF